MKNLEIHERAITIGSYIVDTKSTIRQAASKFGMSKTSIHNDMRKILPQCDGELTKLVSDVMEENKSLRHIRGGETTRRKFQKLKSNNF